MGGSAGLPLPLGESPAGLSHGRALYSMYCVEMFQRMVVDFATWYAASATSYAELFEDVC